MLMCQSTIRTTGDVAPGSCFKPAVLLVPNSVGACFASAVVQVWFCHCCLLLLLCLMHVQ